MAHHQLSNDDLWKSVFAFLGPGNFAYIAPVCRHFYDLVGKEGCQKTTFRNAVQSVSCATILVQSSSGAAALPPNEKKLCCSLAAASGKLEVLQFLWSAGFPLCRRACDRAKGNGHLVVLRWIMENDRAWQMHCTSLFRRLLSTGAVDLVPI